MLEIVLYALDDVNISSSAAVNRCDEDFYIYMIGVQLFSIHVFGSIQGTCTIIEMKRI